MNKLSSFLQPIALLSLLMLAQVSKGQVLASTQPVLNAPAERATRPAHRSAGDPVAPAPLAPVPNATPGWVSLAGSLPIDAPLTAEVLGTGATPLTARTWRGLTAGRVQLELNLRDVPAGTYVLRLRQDNRQWNLPLAVK